MDNLKDNQAIFNAIDKTIEFVFLEEDFVVDLTEGDLEDSWNTILTKDELEFDTNFWVDDSKPTFYFSIYSIRNGLVDTSSQHKIDIVEVIGTSEDYFKEENLEKPHIISFMANVEVIAISREQAKKDLEEHNLDFNDLNVIEVL